MFIVRCSKLRKEEYKRDGKQIPAAQTYDGTVELVFYGLFVITLALAIWFVAELDGLWEAGMSGYIIHKRYNNVIDE